MDGSTLEAQLRRQVGTLRLHPIVRVPVDATLGEAARAMREANVSSALVGHLPRRIVTERDLTRALADGYGPKDPVEGIAGQIPVWATTTSQVFDVAVMMVRHQLRHLILVYPNGEEAGIVSMRDVFALLLPPHLSFSLAD